MPKHGSPHCKLLLHLPQACFAGGSFVFSVLDAAAGLVAVAVVAVAVVAAVVVVAAVAAAAETSFFCNLLLFWSPL